MSKESQDLISSFFNWGLKIVLGISAWFAVTTITDIKDQLKQLGKDQQEMKTELIHIADKLEYHGEEITDLKNRK